MIISNKNERIKYIKKLFGKSFRAKERKYIAEGIKMVNEAFVFGAPVELVVGTEPMLALLNNCNAETIAVSTEVYNYLSDEVTPQGILAVIKMPNLPLVAPSGSCLILDRIRDPGNLGTILRTAAAANIKDIYLYDCVDAYNPKTVRASMSGIYVENIYSGTLQSILAVINKPLVVADADGDNVFNYNTCGDFCLIIGNEANGVSDFLMQQAHKKISIPMQNGIESLNAGVSASILMYLLKR